jgi:hypothetical protein
MKTYRASKFVTLPSGNVRLTKDQERRRSHAIEKVKGREFKIIAPIGFKAGEEFGYDGEIPKALASSIEAVKKKPAEKPDEKGGKGQGQGGQGGGEDDSPGPETDDEIVASIIGIFEASDPHEPLPGIEEVSEAVGTTVTDAEYDAAMTQHVNDHPPAI